MARKIDLTMLDHHIIRRAIRVVGEYETFFTEFRATWQDSITKKQVEIVGEIDSEISLRTAKIEGSSAVYELKKIFTDAELKRINFAINNAHQPNFARAARSVRRDRQPDARHNRRTPCSG